VIAPLAGLLRIGAFSRAVGVSVSAVRAWEARYNLFTPVRTEGGFRLYSLEDQARARRMLTYLERGFAAREAAALALAGPVATDTVIVALLAAWREFDAERAQTLLDELLGDPEPDLLLSRALLPALADAADAWSREELGTARVHFATRLLETRLLALGERWHEGPGPLALVGCRPGDRHTLGTIAFALVLHRRGWRIAYLGGDAPVEAYAATARALDPRRVVLGCTLGGAIEGLRDLTGECALALAGPAADGPLASALGADWLPGDPVAAAELA
jgi:MerR family transcriptional regulator, light-induced transcriptional regulator